MVDPFPAPALPTLLAAGNHEIRTFAGVKGGDHLVLQSHDSPSPTSTSLVTVPLDDNDPQYYLIYTDCNGAYNYLDAPAVGSGSGALKRAGSLVPNAVGDPSGSIPLSNCTATTATFVIITQSYDDTAGRYLDINYAVVPNIAIADQGTVDLSAATYAPVTPATFNVTKVPAALTEGVYQVGYATPTGLVATGRDDHTRADFTVDTGAASTPIGLPTLTGTMVERVELDGTNVGEHALHRWGATSGANNTYTLDVTGLPLVDFGDSPVFDASTNAATWTKVDGATPDVYYIEIDNDRTVPDGSGGSGATISASWAWKIVGPYVDATITPPTLIGDAADYNALVTDTDASVPTMALAKVPGGYDLIRGHAFDFAEPAAGGFGSDPADLSGFAIGSAGHFGAP